VTQQQLIERQSLSQLDIHPRQSEGELDSDGLDSEPDTNTRSNREAAAKEDNHNENSSSERGREESRDHGDRKVYVRTSKWTSSHTENAIERIIRKSTRNKRCCECNQSLSSARSLESHARHHYCRIFCKCGMNSAPRDVVRHHMKTTTKCHTHETVYEVCPDRFAKFKKARLPHLEDLEWGSTRHKSEKPRRPSSHESAMPKPLPVPTNFTIAHKRSTTPPATQKKTKSDDLPGWRTPLTIDLPPKPTVRSTSILAYTPPVISPTSTSTNTLPLYTPTPIAPATEEYDKQIHNIDTKITALRNLISDLEKESLRLKLEKADRTFIKSCI